MLRVEQDLGELEALVRDLPRREPQLADFIDGAAEVLLTRAPGRLDVMGGIADYSGSLVLELPLADATCVAVARSDDAWLRVASRGATQPAAPREARFPAREFWHACRSEQAARAYFAAQPSHVRWAAYALGGLPLLAERGAELAGGLRLLIDSALPEGRGVSSSAALEVAAFSGLAAAWRVPFDGVELGLACQRVENHVVGAPCGVMDQLTSACGEEGRLLALLCQPAELAEAISIPDEMAMWGLDSGVRHSVSSADYGDVRVGAFMGYRMIAGIAG